MRRSSFWGLGIGKLLFLIQKKSSNPWSGSVFRLKCWIRIRIKWIRIRNTVANKIFKHFFAWRWLLLSADVLVQVLTEPERSTRLTGSRTATLWRLQPPPPPRRWPAAAAAGVGSDSRPTRIWTVLPRSPPLQTDWGEQRKCYVPEAYLTHFSYRCWFLNCYVQREGEGEGEGGRGKGEGGRGRGGGGGRESHW